ncbi:MAG: hypothetical protein Fur0032_13860 [Terrimicrobiaceae bacterium]
MKKLFPILFVSLAAVAQAQIAADNSSNYGGTWTNGSNGGTGFLPWSLSNNDNPPTSFAGVFLGDSSLGAGDINVSGNSFGMYANPGGAFSNADRGFASALTTGNIFTFQIALNFDNGNKGFNLYAGAQGEVFNFNVGSGGSVSSANATLTPGPGVGYDYGGNDAVIDVNVIIASATSFTFDISRTSSLGNQGTLFSGTVSGLTEGISGIRFYVSDTDAGGAPQNNLYFNNLSVVPEPSGVALLGLGALSAAWLARRRRSS